MTQDEIIEMATTAYESCNHISDLKIPKEFIFNFAKLVAAKEREVFIDMIAFYKGPIDLEEAIRIRGKA